MAARKSRTVRSADDDLMQVVPPREPREGRCVPLPTGAMALAVCRGEQHKAQAYERAVPDEQAPQKTAGTEKQERVDTGGGAAGATPRCEGTSDDESLNEE